MREDSFKAVLERLFLSDCRLVSFKSGSDGEQFDCTVYCKFKDNKYDENCELFIKEFSKESHSNWITKQRYGNLKRLLFRKDFVCQHSGKNKAPVKKLSARLRDKQCKASIIFKFKKVNKDTIKNDVNLKEGLNCVIYVNFNHTHSVNVAEAFSYLRTSDKTLDTFTSYFMAGMSPAAAKSYHEISIIESSENDNDILTNLANDQVNPTIRQIIYMHSCWRKRHFGDRHPETFLETVKTKKSDLETKGFCINIDEKPKTVAGITPIMKRVFQQNSANDMIFIDSSDQTSTILTFVFTADKIGALPLGCVLHPSETEENYYTAFSLLKESLEYDSDKVFSPLVIMTNDNSAERNSLKKIFPNSKLLLCTFHVCQAVWRWLWNNEHNVLKEERKGVMRCFQSVLYAASVSQAEQSYEKLQKEIEENKKAECYFQTLWERRSEWCLCFRKNVLTKGNDTNNYCEASVRIFKDVVLQRCKAFNACALIEYICNSFENYHKTRLIDFAGCRRDQKIMCHYARFIKSSAGLNVVKTDENEYSVSSGTAENVTFTVNLDFVTCDCPFGRGGRYCKHMCAVEKQSKILLYNHPTLTAEEKINCARIAFGPDIPLQFYSSMDVPLEEEPSCSVSVPVHYINNQNEYNEYHKKEEAQLSQKQVPIDDIRKELCRVSELLEAERSPANGATLNKFYKFLKTIKTPAQAYAFALDKLKCHRRRKIKVQPTSIARRKTKGVYTCSRIQAGRPSKTIRNQKKVPKRKHKLSQNIEANLPSAKLH